MLSTNIHAITDIIIDLISYQLYQILT